MSSNAKGLSETRRNRFVSYSLATLFAFVLAALALPGAAAAATCEDAFASWTTGSRLVHAVPSSTVVAESIGEWDSDVVKIRHNLPGILLLGAKGEAVQGTLYIWDAVNEEADYVGSAVLGGESGNTYTTAVVEGDYCFEVTNYDESEGEYELNINFVDGCTLGTLSPTFCQQM